MTPKQKLFVKEYLVDLNATRAAIAAGYSEKTARQQGARLLSNVDIATELAESAQKRAEKLDISAEKVLTELSRMAFCNMLDYMRVQDGDAYVDFSTLTREQAAAIQEIIVEEYSEGKGKERRDIKRTKFKLAEKRGSLELLGRHLKLFTDKIEHSGTINYTEALTKAKERLSAHRRTD